MRVQKVDPRRLSNSLAFWALRSAVCWLATSYIGCQAEPERNWPDVKHWIRREFPDVQQLSTNELSDWLADDSRLPPVLLDAREKEEFDVSHLHNAKLAPDLRTALAAIGDSPSTDPIVVYCSVGYRSSRLAQEIQQRGFTNVYNLEGSIFQWSNEGRSIFRGESLTTEVHPYDKDWSVLLDTAPRWPASGAKQTK